MQESDKKLLGLHPTVASDRPPDRRATAGDADALAIGPGTVLGKYRIVRRLGAGGMGSVFEATHLEIGKTVALKTLGAHLAADPQARERFVREAAAASQLEHPHVANVTDYGSEGATPYLVMELLRGEDLAARIDRQGGGLSVDETCDIMLAVCAGVSAAHEARIVHRDLKPQNIFLARNRLGDTEPKVLDFGISKMQDERVAASLTASGAVLGTTHYLSPEQVTGREVGPPSDQYSLGVILYECLTGRRPHEAETIYLVMKSISENRVVGPRALRPDLDPQLEAVVLRAMMTDPRDRFASAYELGNALMPFASPRRRVLWAEYYSGGNRSLPSSNAGHLFPPTAPLPRSEPRQRPRPSPVPSGSAEFAPEPFPKTTTSQIVPSSGRSWRWALLAGAIIVGGAGVMVAMRKPAESIPIPVERPRAPSTFSASRSAESQTAERQTERPTAPEDRPVTISVADAPPDLTVYVDGAEAALPLRLPRGIGPRRVEFRAPGYEPRQITVNPSEDRVLTLSLERARPAVPAAKDTRSKQRNPGKRGHERTGPGEGAPPPMFDL